MSQVELLPAGHALVSDVDTYCICLVGGMGSGKTDAIAAKALAGALANDGAPVLVVEPIYSLIDTAFLPAFASVCARAGVDYTWNQQRKEITVHVAEGRRIMCRSADNTETLVGFEVGLTIVDEAGRMGEDIFAVAVQRTRVDGDFKRQIVFASTPEGFNWFCDLTRQPGVRTIRARTRDNPFLPADYVENMTRHLDEQDRRAYLDGEFVAKSGGVYRVSRERNVKPCLNPWDGDVFVGADFNVGKMCWVIGRKIGDEMHIWGEVVSENVNTIEQTEKLTRYLIDHARRHGVSRGEVIGRVTVIPDASASAQKTSASRSDVMHLVDAGYNVEKAGKNPFVRDRVFAVNAALREGLLLVDGDGAPQTLAALEQQEYTKAGDPDKTRGHDGFADAVGYAVYRYLPSWSPRSLSEQAQRKPKSLIEQYLQRGQQ